MYFLPVPRTTFTRHPTISTVQSGFRMESGLSILTFVPMSYPLTPKSLAQWMISKSQKDSSKAKSSNKNFRVKASTLILKTANTRKRPSSMSRTAPVTSTQNMELTWALQFIVRTTWTTEAANHKNSSCKTSTTQQTIHFQRVSAEAITNSMAWTPSKQFQMFTTSSTKFDLWEVILSMILLLIWLES